MPNCWFKCLEPAVNYNSYHTLIWNMVPLLIIVKVKDTCDYIILYLMNVFSEYNLIDLTVSLSRSIRSRDQEASYQLLTVLCEENIVWISVFCFFVLFLHLVNFSCFNSCNKGSFFSTFCEIKNIFKCLSSTSAAHLLGLISDSC